VVRCTRLTFEDDPDDPLLLDWRALLIDLPQDRYVVSLPEPTRCELVKQRVDSVNGELSFFDGRAGGDLVIAHPSEIARHGVGL
jgi:hypothetical protein